MRRVALLMCAALAVSAAAHAESAGTGGEWALRSGVGFSSGPDTFLLGIGLPYRVGPGFSWGPQLQLGLHDNRTLVTTSLNARLHLGGSGREGLRRVQPYLQAGLGLAFMEKDRRGGNKDDLGFLASGGVGFDYALSRRLSVGSDLSINLLPNRVLGERVFFTWQVVTARIRF